MEPNLKNSSVDDVENYTQSSTDDKIENKSFNFYYKFPIYNQNIQPTFKISLYNHS